VYGKRYPLRWRYEEFQIAEQEPQINAPSRFSALVTRMPSVMISIFFSPTTW
jgi:hypothetical protein